MTYIYISCTNTYANQSWPDDDPMTGRNLSPSAPQWNIFVYFVVFDGTLFTHFFIHTTGWLHSKLKESTDTHSEHLVLTAVARQHCLHERCFTLQVHCPSCDIKLVVFIYLNTVMAVLNVCMTAVLFSYYFNFERWIELNFVFYFSCILGFLNFVIVYLLGFITADFTIDL
jgi:hypothetical protein